MPDGRKGSKLQLKQKSHLGEDAHELMDHVARLRNVIIALTSSPRGAAAPESRGSVDEWVRAV